MSLTKNAWNIHKTLYKHRIWKLVIAVIAVIDILVILLLIYIARSPVCDLPWALKVCSIKLCLVNKDENCSPCFYEPMSY